MGQDDFRKRLKAKKDAIKATQPEDAPDPESSCQAPQDTQELDESELMATAFEALSTGHVNIEWERTKVVQPKAPPTATPSPASEPPTAAPVKPVPSVPAPPRLDPAQWQGRAWAHQDFFSGQGDQIDSAEPFSKVQAHQLTPAQTQLLARFAKLPPHEIHELNLRHAGRQAAMAQVRRTTAQMRRFGQRYLRIITGKGIGSAGAPILRQEVVHWCILQAKRQALQWAPELENNQEYGAIFIDLQGPNTPT